MNIRRHPDGKLALGVSFILFIYVTVDSISLVLYFLYICMPLFESTLLSFFANPSRSWTFQRFAMVAEKERTQRNKLKI